MSAIQKLWSKLQHGTFLLWLTDKLAACGLDIRPFYWLREDASSLPMDPANYVEYEFVELDEDDCAYIATLDIFQNNAAQYVNELAADPHIKGYALKKDGKVACFMWCNLAVCQSPQLRRSLGEHEAYLFDMNTIHAFRGKGLAPFLRHQCIEAVKLLGKHKCYSISDFFNTPSIRFKQKMNPNILSGAELYLYIKLLNRWSRCWRLR